MASSASTVLRQELMAQGENDSTWGTKTNTNLGILESAIAGTTAISTTGGTTTLTNVDYTNDEAKKAVLDISGTLASNAIIVIPNASKTYKVINRTTGSFTVTIKTSGGSAITITQSTSAEVYCDGSNVCRFVTPLTDYTTGAPATSSGAAASSVSVTPTGNLASTNAQAALAELQGDIDTLNTSILTYQPLDADLTTIAGLAKTDNNVIIGNGTSWTVESGATLRTSLGLGTGDSPQFTAVNIGAASDTTLTRVSAGVAAIEGSNILLASGLGSITQAYDAELAALAGLTSAADRLPYFTGSGTAALATFTTFARSILDDADEATFKATVNLEIGTDVQAYHDNLEEISALAANGYIVFANGAIVQRSIAVDSNVMSIANAGGVSGNTTLGFATSMDMTGKTMTGMTDIAIADGGTAASTAADAFTNLKQAASTTATGVVELAINAEVVTGTDTARVPPVSALIYHPTHPKAWVNFNGTGTVAIAEDFGVSSITDHGAGLYSANFDSNFASTNYGMVGTCRYNAAPGNIGVVSPDSDDAKTAALYRFGTAISSTAANFDSAEINLVFTGTLA